MKAHNLRTGTLIACYRLAMRYGLPIVPGRFGSARGRFPARYCRAIDDANRTTVRARYGRAFV